MAAAAAVNLAAAAAVIVLEARAAVGRVLMGRALGGRGDEIRLGHASLGRERRRGRELEPLRRQTFRKCQA